jgi:hypothetical protein
LQQQIWQALREEVQHAYARTSAGSNPEEAGR